jgi:GTP-binding protein TrmE N-terminus
MSWFPSTTPKRSLFSLISIKNFLQQSQRYSVSCIIRQRPFSRSARHSFKCFRPNGIAGSQTRSVKAFSSPDGTIPLSPAQKETIYALSTPPGRGGIAVIRISGPKVPRIYHEVVKPVSKSSLNSTKLLPEPWKMHRCSVVDPETRQILDEGLAVYFACTSIFTWELWLLYF